MIYLSLLPTLYLVVRNDEPREKLEDVLELSRSDGEVRPPEHLLVARLRQEPDDVLGGRHLEVPVRQLPGVPDGRLAAHGTLAAGHGEAVGVVRLQHPLWGLHHGRRVGGGPGGGGGGGGLALGGRAAAAVVRGDEGVPRGGAGGAAATPGRVARGVPARALGRTRARDPAPRGGSHVRHGEPPTLGGRVRVLGLAVQGDPLGLQAHLGAHGAAVPTRHP